MRRQGIAPKEVMDLLCLSTKMPGKVLCQSKFVKRSWPSCATRTASYPAQLVRHRHCGPAGFSALPNFETFLKTLAESDDTFTQVASTRIVGRASLEVLGPCVHSRSTRLWPAPKARGQSISSISEAANAACLDLYQLYAEGLPRRPVEISKIGLQLHSAPLGGPLLACNRLRSAPFTRAPGLQAESTMTVEVRSSAPPWWLGGLAKLARLGETWVAVKEL